MANPVAHNVWKLINGHIDRLIRDPDTFNIRNEIKNAQDAIVTALHRIAELRKNAADPFEKLRWDHIEDELDAYGPQAIKVLNMALGPRWAVDGARDPSTY